SSICATVALPDSRTKSAAVNRDIHSLLNLSSVFSGSSNLTICCLNVSALAWIVICKLGPSGRAAAWITYSRRKSADQENYIVAKLLEMPHLSNEHRVAEVQIWRCRIKAGFHSQGHSRPGDSLEFPPQIVGGYAIDAAFPQVFNLLVCSHAEIHYQS